MTPPEPDERPKWVSNADLQLELKALRSDVKVWIIGEVANNQFLAAVDIPTGVTGVAIVGFALKGVVAAVFRGGG